MPRVAVFHHAPFMGGGSAGLRDLLWMVRSEHEAIAVLPPGPEELPALLREDGFTVVSSERPFPTLHAYNGGPSVSSRGYWQGLTPAFRYREWKSFVESLRADVIILNSSVLAPMGAAVRAAGSKSICVVRETFSNRSSDLGAATLSWMMANLVDANVFISQYDFEHAPRKAPVTAVVRDCVRPGALTHMERSAAERELDLDPDSFNVLFTGGDTWFKGLDVLLTSARIADLPNLQILVVGYYSQETLGLRRRLGRITAPENALFRERVRRLLTESSVSKSVKILGARGDMSACYSASDAVVFPATVAHQARPIIEAAHYALPVIRTDFEQYFEHIGDPLRFPVGDAPRLAELLVQIENDPSLAWSLGQANRKRISEANDFYAQARSLLNVISTLL